MVQSVGDNKVYVFCSSYPPKCLFYCEHIISSFVSLINLHTSVVNLTEVYLSATMESEYLNIPTLGKLVSLQYMPLFTIVLVSGLQLATGGLLADFLLRGVDTIEVGPFFNGFCGDHISDHLGTEQQACSPLIVRRAIEKKTRSSLGLSGMELHYLCTS